METKEIEHYFADSTILQENPEEAEELVNLAGYQVTKAELFAHTREPAITIWDSRIKFNMACLRRFPGVTHIQILIHPEQKQAYHPPLRPGCPGLPPLGQRRRGKGAFQSRSSVQNLCGKSL